MADSIGIAAQSAADAPASAGQVARAMGDALLDMGITPALDPFARAQLGLDRGAVPSPRLARFSQVRNLIREGWQAYVAVDTERAIERFQAAQEAARELLDLDGGAVLYADIALRLGAVQLQLGQQQDATHNFRLARTLDPDREVAIASFAPDVVRAFETANAAEVPMGVIRVTSEPEGVRVELDGQDVGPAPVVVQAPVGDHVLVARFPGYRAATRVVSVAPIDANAAGPQPVAVRLSPDAETAALAAGSPRLAVGQSSGDAKIAIRALIRYAEVDGIAVVASVWRGGQAALLGQYCTDIPVVCTRVVEIRFPTPEGVRAASAELWSALRAETRDREPSLLADPRLVSSEVGPGRQMHQSDGGCRICRSRWLWLGVGAAAVAAGATWLIVRDRGIEPIVTVDPCEFGSCP